MGYLLISYHKLKKTISITCFFNIFHIYFCVYLFNKSKKYNYE